jgi:hypothetical protein
MRNKSFLLIGLSLVATTWLVAITWRVAVVENDRAELASCVQHVGWTAVNHGHNNGHDHWIDWPYNERPSMTASSPSDSPGWTDAQPVKEIVDPYIEQLEKSIEAGDWRLAPRSNQVEYPLAVNYVS